MSLRDESRFRPAHLAGPAKRTRTRGDLPSSADAGRAEPGDHQRASRPSGGRGQQRPDDEGRGHIPASLRGELGIQALRRPPHALGSRGSRRPAGACVGRRHGPPIDRPVLSGAVGAGKQGQRPGHPATADDGGLGRRPPALQPTRFQADCRGLSPGDQAAEPDAPSDPPAARRKLPSSVDRGPLDQPAAAG